jgi:hypothetical protein
MKKHYYLIKYFILFFLVVRILYSETPSNTSGSNDFLTYGVGIFISANGSDYYEGIKERPFRTFKKALEYSKISGKKNIFVDSGTYFIDSTLSITQDVEIFGAPYWKEVGSSAGETVIESWESFAKGEDLFHVTNASLILKDITVNDPYKHFQNIFLLENGSLICDRVNICYSALYQSTAIRQKGGKLELANSRIKAEGVLDSEAISCSNSIVQLSQLEMEGPLNCGGFTAMTFLADSSVTCEQINLLLGQGKKLKGIVLEASRLLLNNSTMDAGESTEESVCIETRTATLSVTKTNFICKNIPYKVKAINSFESKIKVHNTIFNLKAIAGLQTIYLNKGSIDLQNSYFHNNDTLEYLYAVNLEYAQGSCSNNIIESGKSSDAVNIMLSNSNTRWLNNTIIGGNGNNITVGFLIRGSIYPVIVNNILSRKTPAKGIAFYLLDYEEKSFYLLANNISGWEIFLKYTNVPKSKSYTAINTVIKTIEELNHYDLVPFGGTIDINMSEEYENTFQPTDAAVYGLRATSRCIDAGLDVNTQQFQGPTSDYLGKPRPNPKGAKYVYDIGAFEFN